MAEINPLYNICREGDVRYYIEHIMLKDLFFKDTKAIVSNISEKLLYDIYLDMYNTNNAVQDFDNDFEVRKMKIAENHYMACCFLPKPIYTPLCYRIYLCFDENTKKLGYFTIEKSTMDDSAFVCSWDAQGTHHNYGQIASAVFDTDTEMMMAIEAKYISDLYFESICGYKKKEEQTEDKRKNVYVIVYRDIDDKITTKYSYDTLEAIGLQHSFLLDNIAPEAALQMLSENDLNQCVMSLIENGHSKISKGDKEVYIFCLD